MIFAIHNGTRIFADEHDPQLLRQWSDAGEITCEYDKCRERLIFVDGQVVVKHFRHQPDSDCVYRNIGSGTSLEHLEAQGEILKALRSMGIEAELEHNVSAFDLRQRADVYAEINGKRWVFEVQRTDQSYLDTQKRTQAYKEKGIDYVLWFFRNLPTARYIGKEDAMFLYDMMTHNVRLGIKHDKRVPIKSFLESAILGRVRFTSAKYQYQESSAPSFHKVMVQIQKVREEAGFTPLADGVFEISEGQCHNCGARAYTYKYEPDANYEPFVERLILPLLQDIQEAFNQIMQQKGIFNTANPRFYKAENSFNFAQGCPQCHIGSIRPDMTRYTGSALIKGKNDQSYTENLSYSISQPPRIHDVLVSAPHWCVIQDDGECLCTTFEL